MEKHFIKKVSLGKILAAGVLALFALSSCTRSLPKQTSVKIIFPSDMRSNKVGSLAVGSLRHLIINVTGPGITKPIFFSWDSRDGQNVAPPSFPVEVPTGDSRLIQVLAVYNAALTADEEFYYGDGTVAVQSDAEVNINVSPIISSGSIGEGQISGRYVDSNTGGLSGPTGRVAVMFKPPNGQPPMTVHGFEMFGGYFRTFALQNAMFDYVLPNGTSLFGGPVSVDHGFGTSPATGEGTLNNGYTMQISMPNYFQTRDSSTFEERSSSLMVFGWFAPAANVSTLLASKSICYADTPADPLIKYAYVDNVGTSELEWLVDADWQAGTNVSGTEDSTEKLCVPSPYTNADRFHNYLSLDHSALGNHDQSLAFQGPYRLKHNNSYPQALDVTYGSGAIHVKYDYLPGAVSTTIRPAVDGSDIFWRARLVSNMNGGDEDYRIDDGVACGRLADFGFKLLASKPANPGALAEDVSITTIPLGFDVAFNDGRLDVVSCPYAQSAIGKNYFRSGVSYHSYQGGTPASELLMSKFIGDPISGLRAANGVCTPFKIKGANGWLQTNQFDFITDSNIDAYINGDCSSPIVSTANLNWAGDSLVVYIKSIGTGTFSSTLTIMDPTSNIMPHNPTINFEDLVSPTQQALAITPISIKRHSCYPASMLIRDTSTADPLIIGLMLSIDSGAAFVWPTLSGLSYYANDPSCSSTVYSTVNSTILAGKSMAMPVFFKYTGASSTLNLTPTYTPASNTIPLPIAGLSSVVTSPGIPKRLSLMMPMDVQINTCQPFDMQLQDNYGYTSPATVAFSATLGATNNGTVYDGSSGCGTCTGALSTVSFAIGDATKKLCYKNTSGGSTTATVSVTAAHNGSSLNWTMNLNVNP